MNKCAVIISAYNVPGYILQCLRSVERQAGLPGWTYEVRLGVDGCSKTCSVLQRNKKPFYYSPTNVGTYIMANSLIALGPADVYARFDADDFMMPGYLSSVIPMALDWGICHAPHIIKPNRHSKPRVGQVTFTHETLEKLGGFYSFRCHCDRDFSRRAMLAGLDVRGMRNDPRIQRGLFIRNPNMNSLTRCKRYGHKSKYRREVRQHLSDLRETETIRIEPETVELSCKP